MTDQRHRECAKSWEFKSCEIGVAVAFAEICGGEGKASQIGVRRRLDVGRNFDLVTGCDLTKQTDIDDLLKYVQKHKPLLVVMGPL